MSENIAYISTTGNDGTGELNTPSLPFLTLQGAVDKYTTDIGYISTLAVVYLNNPSSSQDLTLSSPTKFYIDIQGISRKVTSLSFNIENIGVYLSDIRIVGLIEMECYVNSTNCDIFSLEARGTSQIIGNNCIFTSFVMREHSNSYVNCVGCNFTTHLSPERNTTMKWLFTNCNFQDYVINVIEGARTFCNLAQCVISTKENFFFKGYPNSLHLDMTRCDLQYSVTSQNNVYLLSNDQMSWGGIVSIFNLKVTNSSFFSNISSSVGQILLSTSDTGVYPSKVDASLTVFGLGYQLNTIVDLSPPPSTTSELIIPSSHPFIGVPLVDRVIYRGEGDATIVMNDTLLPQDKKKKFYPLYSYKVNSISTTQKKLSFSNRTIIENQSSKTIVIISNNENNPMKILIGGNQSSTFEFNEVWRVV